MKEIDLYEPLNVLKPIAPDIWIADGPIVRMAAFGGSAPFPTRMAIVRLNDGSLWCHSPIAPDEGLFAAIDGLGPVRHLVSPNKLHYASIAQWKRRYPHAIAWASPGVRERAASRRTDVVFDADLQDTAPPEWAGQIDQMCFRSRMIDEFVFFHRASATVILADLIENFEASKLPRAMRWLARFGGVLAPDGKAPLDMRMGYIGRKRAARENLAGMLAWHPQRVILAHGRCYLDKGEAELRRGFRWLSKARLRDAK